MQAIQTKVLAVTNHRPTRIKAWCQRGKIIISANGAWNMDEDHKRAAQALVDKFVAEDAAQYGEHQNPWAMPRAYGTLTNGDGVHVYLDPIRTPKEKGQA